MGNPGSHTNTTPIDWDNLLPGAELSATVLMASGFVLSEGQRVQERYKVERRLGEGGMGQVLAVSLLGSDEEQQFALKVVARSYPAETSGSGSEPDEAEAARQALSFAELLRAEAAKQDVAQRQGVSVARLFALVQLDGGALGLRMELARGQSLEAQIIREKRQRNRAPDVPGAVRVVRKLISQLRRLHEFSRPDSPFGFVHSDIKPGNVFVEDTDPTDVQVTLLDFGVATAGQALAASLAALHTRRKTLVLDHAGGTLGYVPPYHFAGQVTPLSDVYASIVILYELITLSLPWDRSGFESPRPTLAEMEAAMLKGPKPVRDFRPNLSDTAALALDTFFQREFEELNALAASVAEGLATRDEDVRRALAERLRALARDYQHRLDELYAGLAPTHLVVNPSQRTADSRATIEPAEARPTVVTGAGNPARSNARDAVDEGEGELSDRWTDPPAGSADPSVLRAPLTMRKSAAGSMDSLDEVRWDSIAPGSPSTRGAPLPSDQRPPPVDRGTGGAGLWAFLGLLLLAGAGGGVYWFVLRKPQGASGLATTQGADAAVAATDAAAVALGPEGGAAGATDDASVANAAGDASSGTGLAVNTVDAATRAIEDTGTGRTVARSGTGDDRATSGSSTSSGGGGGGGGGGSAQPGQRCRCVAPARGVTVVARGGGLSGSPVVCVTSNAMPQRPGFFVGAGSIPAEVTRASASFACHGRESYELTQLPTGSGMLFECARQSNSPYGAQTGGSRPSEGSGSSGSGSGSSGSSGSGSSGSSGSGSSGTTAPSGGSEPSGGGATEGSAAP